MTAYIIDVYANVIYFCYVVAAGGGLVMTKRGKYKATQAVIHML